MQALFQSAQHLSEKREGSGSTPLAKGSGSGRSQNMRIQLQIRIPNIAEKRARKFRIRIAVVALNKGLVNLILFESPAERNENFFGGNFSISTVHKIIEQQKIAI